LENDPQLAEELCRSKLTAYSYEFLKTNSGIFPVSIPQSEMSGKMAVIYGAYYLQSHMGGTGILLADTIGAPKPKVVVIGYGNAGSSAIKCALALGLEVVVIGTNPEKLRKFKAMIPSDVKTYINSREVIEREVADADLVIGTILISTYNTRLHDCRCHLWLRNRLFTNLS
jgi:alanine dehydrogenase